MRLGEVIPCAREEEGPYEGLTLLGANWEAGPKQRLCEGRLSDTPPTLSRHSFFIDVYSIGRDDLE